MPNRHIIHLENGRLAADTPAATVSEIVASAIAQAPTGGIAIHFHGGLVSENRALELAERLEPVYEEGHAYPIFFVWEAGLFETIKNNFSELAKEKLFRILFKRVLKIANRKFLQSPRTRAAGVLPDIDTSAVDQAIDDAFNDLDADVMPQEAEPPDDLHELSNAEVQSLVSELELDMALRNEVSAVSNNLRTEADIDSDIATRAPTVRASSRTLMDPDAVSRVLDRPDPGARGILSVVKIAKAIVWIGARVVKRFVDERDHGLHATVVEEILREFYVANIGSAVWSTMKKDTADSFGPDHTIFGGTALLCELRDAVNSGARLPKITLVGHSTGAVYICEMLKAVDEMALPDTIQFDLIFLAPASTFKLTSKTLTNHQSRIRNFRMFTMTDENERDDVLVPVVYPHSLLYFVSGVVEDDADMPVVGMKRYYDEPQYASDQFEGIDTVRTFMSADPKRAIWSIENRGPGLSTSSLKHGDFDNDADTLNSVQYTLEHGF